MAGSAGAAESVKLPIDQPARSPLSAASGPVAAGHRAAPRVLFVDQSGELGGAELCLLDLVPHFAQRGEVVLLEDGPFRERLQRSGIKVSIITDARLAGIKKRSFTARDALALTRLPRLVFALARKARACELIYANTQKAMVLSVLAGWLARKPVLWHLHDIVSAEHFGPFQRRIIKLLARPGLAFVIANSHASATALCAVTPFRRDALRVVHNGIDAAPFERAAQASPADLRQRLGLPRDAFLVGVFGRLAPWKGQHVLLQAAAACQDLRIVVVGSALFNEQAYGASLQALAERLGVAERVHMLGFRDDVAALMTAMDIVVHTSTAPEPFGRVIVEGMLASRPVVASATGGVVEIIEDGVTGLLVAPDQPEQLAQVLRRLQASPALRETLGKNACAAARQSFSIGAYLDGIRQCVEQAARPA
jgi:glycosyltransferase involved in cell wall biosynthesis